ncbi:hypothetical protein M514_28032 [Trichuris suis]|uniref:Uncharacterized protein n=1 Tax=Trichuris suis TaxID=68888 RepID=A0A085MRE5_9BILA|nr:hypothetical protein M514_28032 [Trichuris suis]
MCRQKNVNENEEHTAAVVFDIWRHEDTTALATVLDKEAQQRTDDHNPRTHEKPEDQQQQKHQCADQLFKGFLVQEPQPWMEDWNRRTKKNDSISKTRNHSSNKRRKKMEKKKINSEGG